MQRPRDRIPLKPRKSFFFQAYFAIAQIAITTVVVTTSFHLYFRCSRDFIPSFHNIVGMCLQILQHTGLKSLLLGPINMFIISYTSRAENKFSYSVGQVFFQTFNFDLHQNVYSGSQQQSNNITTWSCKYKKLLNGRYLMSSL